MSVRSLARPVCRFAYALVGSPPCGHRVPEGDGRVFGVTPLAPAGPEKYVWSVARRGFPDNDYSTMPVGYGFGYFRAFRV